MIDRLITTRLKPGKRPSFALVLLFVPVIWFAGCTQNGGAPFASPSIATALTPQEDIPEGDDSSQGAVTSDDKNEQETTLALAPAENEPTPAEKAVTTGAEEARPSEKLDDELKKAPQSIETEETSAQPAPERPKVQSKTLFGAFTSSGGRESGQSTVRRKQAKPQPRLVATTRNSKRARGVRSSRERGSATGLPGVRVKSIFGINEDIEVEEFDEPTRVASVTNLARRGTHGLLLQRPDVKVGCFPRPLLRILKQVEQRFRRVPIVTSGFRSPRHNRRVRGARNSTHVRCMAADIQVKGISKWQLAKYLRGLPGRGGVGTYCHTKSVHIDIGSKRAWHHCRRSRGKKRRRS